MTKENYQTDSQDPVEQWIAIVGRTLLNVSATPTPIVNDSVILRMAVRELLAVRSNYQRHLAKECTPKTVLLISEDDQLRTERDTLRESLERVHFITDGWSSGRYGIEGDDVFAVRDIVSQALCACTDTPPTGKGIVAP